MNFIFEQFKTGGDRNFGYLIGDREKGVGALVDPSYRPELLIERAKAQKLTVKYIINTHGHHDHINGNEQAKQATGAQIAIFKESAVPHDLVIEDETKLSLGQFTLQCFHTPGHAEDHIVIFIPQYQIALTGDHLFVGKIGGTSGEEDGRLQFDSLHRLLNVLPMETTIWPGHDYGCRPSSTLLLEKETNPFLLAKSLEAFIHLKTDWKSFKAEYGLR